MDILISIKPIYANRILDGSKRYEFRRRTISKPIKKAFIYSTKPISKIVGYFTLLKILKNKPPIIWEICKTSAGISKDDFYKYFFNAENAYAFEIDSVFRFKVPLSLNEIFCISKAPQSFIYVDKLIPEVEDLQNL